MDSHIRRHHPHGINTYREINSKQCTTAYLLTLSLPPPLALILSLSLILSLAQLSTDTRRLTGALETQTITDA